MAKFPQSETDRRVYLEANAAMRGVSALLDKISARQGISLIRGTTYWEGQLLSFGDFTGPPSSVAGNFVGFADASGKVGEDSGYGPLSFDLAGTAAALVAAVNQYSDEKARDAIGTALTNYGGLKWVIDDAGDTIQAKVTREVQLYVTDPNGAALTTGDGKHYFWISPLINGMNLIGVAAAVSTVSSSGLPTIQLARVRSGTPADILSTKLTIDASEFDSSSAATPAVIDTSKDDMVTSDQIRVDVDGSGTNAKGLIVILTFELP